MRAELQQGEQLGHAADHMAIAEAVDMIGKDALRIDQDGLQSGILCAEHIGEIVIPHVHGLSRAYAQPLDGVQEDARLGFPQVEHPGSYGKLEVLAELQRCQLFIERIAAVGYHRQPQAGLFEPVQGLVHLGRYVVKRGVFLVHAPGDVRCEAAGLLGWTAKGAQCALTVEGPKLAAQRAVHLQVTHQLG